MTGKTKGYARQRKAIVPDIRCQFSESVLSVTSGEIEMEPPLQRVLITQRGKNIPTVQELVKQSNTKAA